MRYFKIHPDVACCAYKHGVLHDKSAVYPETQWQEGEAMERVEKGFLTEVKEQENKEGVPHENHAKRFDKFKK